MFEFQFGVQFFIFPSLFFFFLLLFFYYFFFLDSEPLDQSSISIFRVYEWFFGLTLIHESTYLLCLVQCLIHCSSLLFVKSWTKSRREWRRLWIGIKLKILNKIHQKKKKCSLNIIFFDMSRKIQSAKFASKQVLLGFVWFASYEHVHNAIVYYRWFKTWDEYRTRCGMNRFRGVSIILLVTIHDDIYDTFAGTTFTKDSQLRSMHYNVLEANILPQGLFRDRRLIPISINKCAQFRQSSPIKT